MRSVRCVLGLFLVLALLLPMSVARGAQPTDSSQSDSDSFVATVDADVEKELDKTGETTIWVVMRAKANLTQVNTIDDWTERGEFVYDALTETAERTQTDVLTLLERHGVQYESFWVVNTIKVSATKALVEDLAQRSDVARIRADKVQELPEPTPGIDEATVQAVEWGIDRIGAPSVWSTFGTRGEGVVIANIDTGVKFDHPALVSQYRGSVGGGVFDHNYNWVDPSNICGNPSLVPCDNNDHGTHTMGTMVGDDGSGNQIGVAPGATWISAKGCEARSCSDAALLASG